jgi:serine/threonine protein kinase
MGIWSGVWLGVLAVVFLACLPLRKAEPWYVPANMTWSGGIYHRCNASACAGHRKTAPAIYIDTYAARLASGAFDGDWNNGTSFFVDPLPEGATLVSVTTSVFGRLDCDRIGGGRFTNVSIRLYLNNVLLAEQTFPSETSCDVCNYCVFQYDFPMLSTWTSGHYQYGSTNMFQLVPESDSFISLSEVGMNLGFETNSGGSSNSDDVLGDLSLRDLLIGGVGVIVSIIAVCLLLVCCVTPVLVKQKGVKTFLEKQLGISGDADALNSGSDNESDPILLWTKMSDERKQVAISELELGEMIGKGSYGEVYKAYWMDTVVAVKMLPAQITGRLDTTLDREAYEFLMDFKREAAIMKSLRHPNILQILATYLDPPNLCMVTEFMAKGSLYGVLHGPDMLRWSQVNEILLDAARGISYLHNLTPVIIHRDLKSQNLLIDAHMHCKVSDFGLAKMMGTRTLTNMTSCGTPCWTAPEVLRNERYSEKADVFSFGVVIWECITRDDPHSHLPPFQVIYAVGSQGLRPTIPDTCPPEISLLMQRCWNEDPDLRPTFRDIIPSLMRLSDFEFDIPPRASEVNVSGVVPQVLSNDDRWLIDHIKSGMADTSAPDVTQDD